MSSVSQYTGLLLVVIFVAVFAVLAVSTMAVYFFCKCKKKKKKVRQIRPTVKRDGDEEDEEQGVFFQRSQRGRGLHWVSCTEIESPRIPGVSGNYVVPQRASTNDRDYHRITQRVSVDNEGNYNSGNFQKRDTVVAANVADVRKPKVRVFDCGGKSRVNTVESGDFKEIQRVRYYNDTYYNNHTKAAAINVQTAENIKPNRAIEKNRNIQRGVESDEESCHKPVNWNNIDDGEDIPQTKIINVNSAENYKMRKWGNAENFDSTITPKRINVDRKKNILAKLNKEGPKEITEPIQINGDGDNRLKLSERVKADLTFIMEGLSENNSSQEDTSDGSQINVNTPGGIFTKPQRIKVRDCASREKARDSVSRDSFTRENIRDSMSRENVRNSMSRERARDSMSRENVRDSMSRENVRDSMSRENVRDSMSRENVRDSMSRENVKNSMSRERARDSMSRKNDRDSMSQSHENVGDGLSRERVRDSMSRESGTKSVNSLLGKRQRVTKYDNDKPREARTMRTSLGSDPSSYMFTASSKTAWSLDS